MTLMQLLAEGTQCLGLWFAPAPDAAQAATALLAGQPIQLVAVGGESALPTLQPDAALAHHLGDVADGTLVLVRPDAYRAATLTDATPAAIDAALRVALALPTTPEGTT